jgi:hypothetical protein
VLCMIVLVAVGFLWMVYDNVLSLCIVISRKIISSLCSPSIVNFKFLLTM